MSSKLGMFLLGGAIGAAAALLYAPRSGAETRALAADKANEAWGHAQHYGTEAQARGQQIYDNVAARGQEVYRTATTQARGVYDRTATAAQGAFTAAQSRVQTARDNMPPVIVEKNDELREKIESARQRIASQVARNAAESQSAIDDAIDIADAPETVDTAAATSEPVDAAEATDTVSQSAVETSEAETGKKKSSKK